MRSLAVWRFGVPLLAILGAALYLLPGWGKSTPAAIGEGYKLPVGTLLPVSLEHDLSSKDPAKGEAIEGRLMQDLPLAGVLKISAGSRLKGEIVETVAAEKGTASVTFRFTSLEPRKEAVTFPIVVALRAMAPYVDVRSAGIPYKGSPDGSPSNWETTLQIGGDVRYGDGGKVNNRHRRKIGKATTNGGVLARPEDSPGSPCAGWPDTTELPQALWVFSADACGLYDLNGMRIEHAGNKEPLGEITLTKNEGDIKIMKSSGLLLRVVR
ncbi:MAG TPA: hypothetical protein VL128_16240 [Candidatus Eisenbacteria bacterium]|nr:hypothetical protein [Candidatus Eisenbacteria bacterium]